MGRIREILIAPRQTEADLVIIAGDLSESQRVKDNLIGFVVEGLKSLTVFRDNRFDTYPLCLKNR